MADPNIGYKAVSKACGSQKMHFLRKGVYSGFDCSDIESLGMVRNFGASDDAPVTVLFFF